MIDRLKVIFSATGYVLGIMIMIFAIMLISVMIVSMVKAVGKDDRERKN